VYGPAGTRRQVDKLLDYLDWDIEVRRSHMHDRRPPEVRVTEIEEGKVLDTGAVRVSAFLVEHDPVKPPTGSSSMAAAGRSSSRVTRGPARTSCAGARASTA
jgi:hypothetical protein